MSCVHVHARYRDDNNTRDSCDVWCAETDVRIYVIVALWGMGIHSRRCVNVDALSHVRGFGVE